MMRILHLIAGARYGGAETFFVDAALTLAEAGVVQRVVTRPYPERMAQLERGSIETITAPFSFLPFDPTRGRIRRAVNDFQPDFIQAWMGRAASMVPLVTKAQHIPVIGWFGGYYDLKRYRNCDYFIGVTPDIVTHIVAAGAPCEHTRVIETIARLEYARSVARASLATPEDAPVILALARLHRKKGLDCLLDAMIEVPQAYLWIAGEGPERSALQSQTQRLALTERVRFLGWRTDRAALLAAATICAFPSRYEPFGTVMVEAWGAGTPIVAAASAGPKAYLRHGVDGLLCPIDNSAALAAALRCIIDQQDLRQTLIHNGKQRYQQQFSPARLVADYHNLARWVA